MTAFFSRLSRLISTANSAFRRSSKSGTVSDNSDLSFSYICWVSTSVVSIVCIDKLQTHIKNFRRMRQRADGNVIHAGAGYFEHIRERYVARSFQFCASGRDVNGLAHQLERHIIEQDSFNSERQRFAYVVQGARFDFDLDSHARSANPSHRRADRAGEIDVVVLY